MRRKILLTFGIMLGCAGAAWLAFHAFDLLHVPPSWVQLQHWLATAAPGEMLCGNTELVRAGGKHWVAVHGQQEAIKFLYSDAPEYLGNATVGKGLAYMRLSADPQSLTKPNVRMKFGVGLHHINKTFDPLTNERLPQTLSIIVRLAPAIADGGMTCRNDRVAVVRLEKGAFGEATRMPVFAGKQCAQRWFSHPNVAPVELRLRPGESGVVFRRTLAPDTGINAMFDLTTNNAYFVKVYVVFGTPLDFSHIAFAPYDNTIGTNCGTGLYWKRTLRPAPGTPPFDAANLHHHNRVHFRFYHHLRNVAQTPDMQYLVDETWNLRPEGPGKDLVRRKGGQRRPFKGDYNVEYSIEVPVTSRNGRPARFAVVDTQRFGLFGGAARTSAGVVAIPVDHAALLRDSKAGEGVLLDRIDITGGTTDYTFHWFLSGGSYGDQEFMLFPLQSSADTPMARNASPKKVSAPR